jgi:LCP family protein required for cell wall assembly
VAQAQRRGRHAASSRTRRASPAAAQVATALLSGTILLATGVGWATVGSLQRDLHTTDALGPPPAGGRDGTAGDNTPAGDGATDILLVGSDSRTDAKGDPLPPNVLRTLRTEQAEGTNTDTIILVRVPEDGTAAHAVSIPRDTLVDIPGKPSDKINSVYQSWQTDAAHQLREQGLQDEAQVERQSAQAGRRALVKTVSELAGIRIDHYAEVNLYGFALLTEAIGGVEVCLNAPVSDAGSGADFPAGRQTLSGGDALSFVRQRNGLPRGDLDRIVRQQVFLAGAVRGMLSAGTLTNPERLSALAAATRKSVVLDEDWDLLSFAQQMQGIAAGSVDFVTIPVYNIDAHDGRGHSVVTVDPQEVRAFMAELVGVAAPRIPGGTTATRTGEAADTVDVLNGTDVAGLASEVSNRLATVGFIAGNVDNTAALENSVIKVAPSRATIGERVSALLGGRIPVRTDPKLAEDRIVILLGADYRAQSGNRLTGPPPLRLDGATARTAPPPARAVPPPPAPPINANGVPCIN